MSLFKRILAGSLASVRRKAPAQGPRDRAADGRASGRLREGAPAARPSSAATPGIKVVILNWRLGGNDPFSVMSAAIREHFHRCGKNAEIIEISSDDWPARLLELAAGGIELVFTWQGLGSRATIGETGPSLWEVLKVPLICAHGDHPCHTPPNHELESRFCFHLYMDADFARYSNRHFRRLRGASVIDYPKLHCERPLGRREGDYFVVAKNITDCVETEASWRQTLDRRTFDLYMAAAETLKSRIALEAHVEMHDVLDDLIAREGFEWLDPGTDPGAFHLYHSQLDNYLRSHKAMAAVAALREFPVRVYGRGWDRAARTAPARHAFEPGRSMAQSQELYYSRYGLVDISPSKELHDRTRRAMANGTGFLSSANLEDRFSDLGRFDRLFFSFRPQELPERCARVVDDPDAHRELARQFANLYHDRYHFRDFVDRLDILAKSAREL